MASIRYLTTDSPLAKIGHYGKKIVVKGKIIKYPNLSAFFSGNGAPLGTLAYINGKWRVKKIPEPNYPAYYEKYKDEIKDALLLAESLYPGGLNCLTSAQKKRKLWSGSWRRPEKSRLGKKRKKKKRGKIIKPQKRD